MVGKREEKRHDLRQRLIRAATSTIERGGVHALNAREITKEANCALGSLYTAFKDLDDLIIHVNSATLRRLGEAIIKARSDTEGPVETLKALTRAYVDFARSNYALWAALFDYGFISGVEIPDWHRQEQSLLIDHIAAQITKLSPAMTANELATRSRTHFSAVHGIVSNSLASRYIGVAQDKLESELMNYIDQMIVGIVPSSRG